MSGLKWTRNRHASSAMIGPIRLVAWDHDIIGAGCEVNGHGATLDEAERAAEAHLLQLHGVLCEHFDPLPVLRWIDNGDGELVAQNVNGWTLGASHGNWWLEHDTTRARVLSPRPNTADAEVNRRAAEAALSALGVPFRTPKDGEQ